LETPLVSGPMVEEGPHAVETSGSQAHILLEARDDHSNKTPSTTVYKWK